MKPGAVQVLCHHGFGYAIEQWPGVGVDGLRYSMRSLLELLAEVRSEPFAKEMPAGTQGTAADWATFYWRFRYAGKKGARPVERLQFSDVERCMR